MYANNFNQHNTYFESQQHHHDRMLYPYLNALYPDESHMQLEFSIKEFTAQGSSAIGSTATSKSLIFDTDMDEDSGDWRHKDRRNWTSQDVLKWIANVAAVNGFPCEEVNVHAFKVDGKTLLAMTVKDFADRDGKYGDLLYDALHMSSSSSSFQGIAPKKEIKLETLSAASTRQPSPYNLVNLHLSPTKTFQSELDVASSSEPYPFDLDPVIKTEDLDTGYSSERKNSIESTSSSSSSDSELSDYEVNQVKKKPVVPGKRPPGRPPGAKTKKDKPEKKIGRLWEFIRDLLLDPKSCPSLIRWENHDDGVFKFVDNDTVAKIWGNRKGNDKMNYEKLSRAMRYYYRKEVLQPVIGRRLVYKFGPTAQGWQTENPNFNH